MYWAGSCGGCEIALLEIKEKIVEVDATYDVVFWPAAADFKYKDLEAYDDDFIDVCLFNGCIRNSENEHIAKVLRDKSKFLVAFGACAVMGGIPGLANVADAAEIKKLVYIDQPSIDNPDGVYPQEHFTVPEGELELPHMYDTVKTLDQTVDVDYYVPGCAPEAHQIAAVLDVVTAALKGEGELPPKGATVGVSPKTCCDECERVKEEKKVHEFKRIWEFLPDPEKCLLEQGLVCMGPATHAGCGGPLHRRRHALPRLLRRPRGRHRPGRQDAQHGGVDRRRADPRGDRRDRGDGARPRRDLLPLRPPQFPAAARQSPRGRE